MSKCYKLVGLPRHKFRAILSHSFLWQTHFMCNTFYISSCTLYSFTCLVMWSLILIKIVHILVLLCTLLSFMCLVMWPLITRKIVHTPTLYEFFDFKSYTPSSFAFFIFYFFYVGLIIVYLWFLESCILMWVYFNVLDQLVVISKTSKIPRPRTRPLEIRDEKVSNPTNWVSISQVNIFSCNF